MLAFEETKYNRIERRTYTLWATPSILSFSLSIERDENMIHHHVCSSHEPSACLYHQGPNDVNLKVLSVTIIVYKRPLGCTIYDSRYQVTLIEDNPGVRGLCERLSNCKASVLPATASEEEM